MIERWYIGAMNDAAFIINTHPRPSTDDVIHDRTDGPTLVLRTYPLKDAEIHAIVDAHNDAIDGLANEISNLRMALYAADPELLADLDSQAVTP